MADRKIYTTLSFARHHAGARFVCTVCHHSVSVSPAVIATMFPRMMLIDDARRALRCSLCGAKKARIEVLWRPDRG